ncbi:glycosyltransferase family 39 protein [Ammoniphilus sp. 3BR4]
MDFALGLSRFDLLAMQPHFPGYPYFILGGMMVHQWISDPVQSLSIFNVLMSAASSIPIYLLARNGLSKLESLFITFCIQCSTYFWILTSQPMSEGSALSVLWWYLWSLYLANKHRTWLTQILPLFLFSILMGIRLSYFVFGVGIIYLWIKERRALQGQGYWQRWAVYFILAICFQLVWVTGLVMSEGSWSGFLELSFQFVKGHFTEWGGSALSNPQPLLDRGIVLLFENFLWTGLIGQSMIIASGMVFLFILMIIESIRFGFRIHDFRHYYGMASLLILYFIYAWFAQNIDKPRHIAPLIGPSLLLFYILILRTRRNLRIKWGLLVMMVSVQFFAGMTLSKEQATVSPATYQLADHLNAIESPFLVYTWEETRVMEYLQVPYEHKRIFTYEIFMEDLLLNQGKRIFLTNAVVEGFKSQGYDVSKQIREIGQFSSNPLFDPVYHDITLYEWMIE